MRTGLPAVVTSILTVPVLGPEKLATEISCFFAVLAAARLTFFSTELFAKLRRNFRTSVRASGPDFTRLYRKILLSRVPKRDTQDPMEVAK